MSLLEELMFVKLVKDQSPNQVLHLRLAEVVEVKAFRQSGRDLS